MTPKVQLSLSEAGCRKPKCKHRFDKPNRHHMGSEKQWLNQFNRPGGAPTFRGDAGLGRRMVQLLREHYYAFRKRDTVILCEWHHVEIHQIYKFQVLPLLHINFRKRKEFFNFEEALAAIRACRKKCREWLKEETPGINPRSARSRGQWS